MNKILYCSPLANNSITASKSVPCSLTLSVCNTKQHFLAFSIGKVSIKYLYAKIVSGICLRLIFLELNNKAKSYSLPLNKFFLNSFKLVI